MTTVAFFHAHPDDEAIATGGTMAQLSDAGHRVVVVLATRGEHGEQVPGVLEPGEELADRRVAEARQAAGELGVAQVRFLGYGDSGMMGEPSNDEPGSFWRADPEEAADRLARMLVEEGAEALVVYDDHGGYGHPDHIQVHRVGTAAAARAGIDRVFQVTMNRDRLRSILERETADHDGDHDVAEQRRRLEEDDFGSPESVITHAIDVRHVLDRKRAAMVAHRSQIAPDSFFLQMPPAMFEHAFGTEWYIDPSRPRAGGPFRSELV